MDVASKAKAKRRKEEETMHHSKGQNKCSLLNRVNFTSIKEPIEHQKNNVRQDVRDRHFIVVLR